MEVVLVAFAAYTRACLTQLYRVFFFLLPFVVSHARYALNTDSLRLLDIVLCASVSMGDVTRVAKNISVLAARSRRSDRPGAGTAAGKLRVLRSEQLRTGRGKGKRNNT